MQAKIMLIALAALVLAGCGGQKSFEEFSSEFQDLESRYFDKIYALNQKARSIREDGEMEKLRNEYQAISLQRQQELQKFLEKLDRAEAGEEILILQAKVLIELNKAPDAEKTIARLKKIEKPKYPERAAFEEIKLLAIRGDYQGGIKLFKLIENRVNRDVHYYNLLMLFAMNAADPRDQLAYGQQFIESRDLPEEFWQYRERVLSSMAEARKKLGEIGMAREHLQKALSLSTDLRYKEVLEKQLIQMKLIGEAAPEIASAFSLNNIPQNWARARSGITLIYFWAGWSEASQQLFYAVNEVAKIFQPRGISVIGINKLFGRVALAGQVQSGLEQPEETRLLRSILEQNRIAFPCFLDQEGKITKAFGIYLFPTLAVIDPRGRVHDIYNGFFDRPQLEELLKKWLEEK